MTTVTDWVEVTAACGRCSTEDTVSVPAARHARWMGLNHYNPGQDGAHGRPNVEEVFPELTPSQRDILIGADTTRPFPFYLCAPCWDLTFQEEDE